MFATLHQDCVSGQRQKVGGCARHVLHGNESHKTPDFQIQQHVLETNMQFKVQSNKAPPLNGNGLMWPVQQGLSWP